MIPRIGDGRTQILAGQNADHTGETIIAHEWPGPTSEHLVVIPRGGHRAARPKPDPAPCQSQLALPTRVPVAPAANREGHGGRADFPRSEEGAQEDARRDLC